MQPLKGFKAATKAIGRITFRKRSDGERVLPKRGLGGKWTPTKRSVKMASRQTVPNFEEE
jgi:hypothetical protein